MTNVIKFQFGDGYVPYLQFGNSRGEPLIIVPGLSDGFEPMKGAMVAKLLKWTYRRFDQYRIIIPSRPVPTPMGKTTREMAEDLFGFLKAKKALPANVIGLSMGGFIGQYLAADHPDAVTRLVLGVTVAHVDEPFRELLAEWERLLQAGRWSELRKSAITRVYTPNLPLYYRFLLPIAGLLRRRPKDVGRYLAHSAACAKHDSREVLGNIQCPTLVIAGESDTITRPDMAREMAESIPRATLQILSGCGHGAFEQKKKECNNLVNAFLST